MIRVAVPCENGRVSAHFGHALQFALFDVDPTTKEIRRQELIDAPPHQQGMLPAWVAEQGATVVLAGGMGGRAQQRFAEAGIQIVTGVLADDPQAAVAAYLAGTLESTGEVCDHRHRPCH